MTTVPSQRPPGWGASAPEGSATSTHPSPPGATPGRGRLLVRNARPVPLDGVDSRPDVAPVDLRIADGMIVEVAPRLERVPGEDELDAGGHWTIPGLWDHHVHAGQWIRSTTWVDLAGTASAREALDRLAAHIARLDASGADPHQVVTGFGYRSVTWPSPASVADLDAISGDRLVIAIAGDAHNGWLNSRAQAALGLPHRDTAHAENDWFSVIDRLSELPGFDPSPQLIRSVVAGMAARGITGIVDFEFSDSFRQWPRLVADGLDLIRVVASVYPHQLDEAIGLGLSTGGALPGGEGLVTMGPLKIITDGSLGTRTAWCCQPYLSAPGDADCGAPNLTGEELRALIERADSHGLGVATHAIGDRANQAVLDAFAATGVHGRVEHAQLLRLDDIGRLADLGIAASIQPAHVLDDRDIADDCWADRTERAFMMRSLQDAGVRLLFGSDAPVAPLDPWLAMAAAVHRSGDEREAWHPEQSLTVAETLACSVDGQRLAPGGRGDLVVLGDDPLRPCERPEDARALLRGMPVLATVCAGRVTHRADP